MHVLERQVVWRGSMDAAQVLQRLVILSTIQGSEMKGAFSCR